MRFSYPKNLECSHYYDRTSTNPDETNLKMLCKACHLKHDKRTKQPKYKVRFTKAEKEMLRKLFKR